MVEPCGCTGDPLGGVARLAAAVKEVEQAFAGRSLFVDGGDLFFENIDNASAASRCQSEARLDLLLSTYARLGLVGTVTGPMDEWMDEPQRRALLDKHRISLLPDDGMVVERGPVRVALVPLRLDSEGGTEGATLRLQHKVDRQLAQSPDVVVVIAQAPLSIVQRIAERLVGVDVVIAGRASQTPLAPQRVGKTVVVSAGFQAQHVGVLEFDLEGRTPGAPLPLDDQEAVAAGRQRVLDSRILGLEGQLNDVEEGPRREFFIERLAKAKQERAALDDVATHAQHARPPAGPSLRVRAVPLPRGVPEEAPAASALGAYQAAIPDLVLRCEQNLVCKPAAPDQASYVGVSACQGCHAAAVAFWEHAVVTLPGKDKGGQPISRRVGHALAWQSLVHENKERDRSCVGCHSVGFLEPGGPCTTTHIVERGLQGVQCEACHGPGSRHIQTRAKKDIGHPDENRCRACHHPPHIPTQESFVLHERLQHILGDGHGAQKKKELQ